MVKGEYFFLEVTITLFLTVCALFVYRLINIKDTFVTPIKVTTPSPSISLPGKAVASASIETICNAPVPADQINVQNACTNVNANNVDAVFINSYLTKLNGFYEKLSEVLKVVQNVDIKMSTEIGKPNSVYQVNISGDPLSQTIHFVIPQGGEGPQGISGDQGETGEKGPKGPTGPAGPPGLNIQ